MDAKAELDWLDDFAERNGYRRIKRLPARPGWYACILRQLFNFALVAGEIGDEVTVGDRWDYETEWEVKHALDAWDGSGEPQGWIRHPFSGRRRPQGDAAGEYIHP